MLGTLGELAERVGGNAVGDRHGNLFYRQSARNFNPLAAMCGRVTVAEVEHLVEPGDIEPDSVHTPGVFVQRIIQCPPGYEKRIEQRTTRKREAPAAGAGTQTSAA